MLLALLKDEVIFHTGSSCLRPKVCWYKSAARFVWDEEERWAGLSQDAWAVLLVLSSSSWSNGVEWCEMLLCSLRSNWNEQADEDEDG